MKSYPYSKQHIDSKDVKSVINALNSDIITGGSVALNFEKKITTRCKKNTQTCPLKKLYYEHFVSFYMDFVCYFITDLYGF